MGDWIRKIFSDSLSFPEKKKGEGTSPTSGSDGQSNRRTMVVPRSSNDHVQNRDCCDRKSLGLVVSLMDAKSIHSLIDTLSTDLSRIIPFDFGTLRWNPLDPQNDEWLLDMEDDFPESLDIIANDGVLAGSGSIELHGPVECDEDVIWSGEMDGTCRARTPNGDPMLIKLRSGLVVPLRKEDRNIGILSLFSTKEDGLSRFTRDPASMSIWNALGSVLGNIIEMDNTNSELRRTRELLDSTEDLLVLWKSTGSFWEIECNKQAEKFIDRNDVNPEMMEGPFFAPPGKEWERAMFVWKRAFSEGQTHQIDIELISPSGDQIPYMCTFSPYIVDGEITGVKMTGIETDSIDSAVTSMGSSNKGYRLLLSLLSHDLKNPLSAVRGYTELLDLTGEDKKDHYTGRIKQMIDRMSKTIELAGMLTRVQEGKLDKEFQTIDISRTITSSIENLQPRISEYDVRFRQGNGEFILNGHIFLEQVFINLLDNAMKYSPKGSRIDIGLSTDLNGLNIVFKDQGEGVPEDHRTSIFERFEKGAYKDGNDGLGLGLAISKGIVDLHGGSIWVENNTPSGSIFKISLPWSNE